MTMKIKTEKNTAKNFLLVHMESPSPGGFVQNTVRCPRTSHIDRNTLVAVLQTYCLHDSLPR